MLSLLGHKIDKPKEPENPEPTPATYCNPISLPNYPLGRKARDVTVGAPVPRDDWLWLVDKQQQFRESFAQDVDPLEASIMATVQKPANAAIFGDPTTAVAWKTLPSWYLISTNDRMIPPSVQQMFASRMQATTISVPSSHASIVSHPVQVFGLIQAAATVGANR